MVELQTQRQVVGLACDVLETLRIHLVAPARHFYNMALEITLLEDGTQTRRPCRARRLQLSQDAALKRASQQGIRPPASVVGHLLILFLRLFLLFLLIFIVILLVFLQHLLCIRLALLLFLLGSVLLLIVIFLILILLIVIIVIILGRLFLLILSGFILILLLGSDLRVQDLLHGLIKLRRSLSELRHARQRSVPFLLLSRLLLILNRRPLLSTSLL
mmetsp:Transcript_1422/g.2939  ORF Transcript_1422/g.2939 Transcript_1422/m.2939 type:complete len:217 (-) Transcript_1422:73-723(-)